MKTSTQRDPSLVWIALANQKRIRELLTEFQELADRRTALVGHSGYSHSEFMSLSLEIESTAYKLVGCLQGTALG